MTKPLNLIILGPQGSGKGTQAELLAKKFNLVVLGAGYLLREIAKTNTPLGREVHQRINVEGRHVRPEIISEVFKDKLQSLPPNQGVIMESYPRNLDQYAIFEEFWPKLHRGDYQVLFIELSVDEAVKRLSIRRVCENCEANYIAGSVERCARCGGRLIQRVDDHPEAVKERLKLFSELTLPMVEQMEKGGKVIRINGAPSIEEVNKEILEKLHLDQGR